MTRAHTTDIAVTRRSTPAAVPADLAAVPFSAPLSDHMFLAEWTDGAWSQARHIASIHHGADVIALPGGGVGPVATTLRERLVGIGSGAAPDPYGWIVPVAPEAQR